MFGFTGAITKSYWSDANPSSEEGEIVIGTRTPRGAELLSVDLDGTNQRTIATLSARADNIAVSPDGVWLYFVETQVLKRIPMAGGMPTTLLSDVYDFCLTPSGSKLLVFRPVAQTLSVINANGTGLVDRVNNVGPQTDVIGAVSESYAYVAVKIDETSPEIRGITLTGAPAANVFFEMNNIQYHIAAIDWKRESMYLRAFDGGPNKHVWWVARLSGNDGSWFSLRDDLDQLDWFSSISFLSDNARMLVAHWTAQGWWTSIYTDNHTSLMRILPITSPEAKVAFAPAPTFRTLVGAGNYASGAAMVMFSEKGNRTPAVVLADCTTRASMTLTRISDDNDGTLIYQLNCDNLTKLHYTKSNNFAQVGVIGSLTGLKGAFIAFNAETGRVSNVITFTKKPTVDRRPEGLVLRGGEMIDQFDATGNRKPIGDSIILR